MRPGHQDLSVPVLTSDFAHTGVPWPGGQRIPRGFVHAAKDAPEPRRHAGGMKLVIGIVRPEKANEVLEALYRAEVRGFSMSHVQGHGGELDRVETYRGTTVRVGMSDKVRFEIAVSDEFVEPTVEALCDGGRTGEVGDGKIFVLDLEQVVRIRTGEVANAAVTPVGA
jgi:nitrogen regulatory protein PII